MTEKADQKYALSEEVINGILNYLGSQPYGNVVKLVEAIHQDAKPLDPTPPPAAEEEKGE